MPGRAWQGVHLENARLEGADLRGVGLERAFLTGATYDGRTCWPEGFDPGALGAVAREDGRIVVGTSAQEVALSQEAAGAA